MNDTQHTNLGILAGFGERLKAERLRLKLSQQELGDLGGVGRLTQLQYESEKSFPTTKYLNAVAQVGVDLMFLLFNFDKQLAYEYQVEEIDQKVLNLIRQAIDRHPDKKVSADTFILMFQVTKKMVVQIAQGELAPDFKILNVISQSAA